TPEIKKNILVVLENESAKEDFDRQIYDTCDYIYKSELTFEKLKSFDFVTFFNNEFIYEEYYLEDMISAFKYTDVDFVSKNIRVEAHKYIDNISNLSKENKNIDEVTNLEDESKVTNGYNLDKIEK